MTIIRQSFNMGNMTKVIYQGHQKRSTRAQALWRQILKMYNSGKSAQEIADTYINPHTGKNYTRSYIYWALQKAKELGL